MSRLAASISSLEVYQITLRKGYSIADLKAELATLYIKAGLKNMGIVFLMTDAQVPDERFLVLINDLLASGEIPDLFPEDELENIIAGMRNEVKSMGMEDSRENCWKIFIEKVRKLLKVWFLRRNIASFKMAIDHLFMNIETHIMKGYKGSCSL